jgi:hypothetical protein
VHILLEQSRPAPLKGGAAAALQPIGVYVLETGGCKVQGDVPAKSTFQGNLVFTNALITARQCWHPRSKGAGGGWGQKGGGGGGEGHVVLLIPCTMKTVVLPVNFELTVIAEHGPVSLEPVDSQQTAALVSKNKASVVTASVKTQQQVKGVPTFGGMQVQRAAAGGTGRSGEAAGSGRAAGVIGKGGLGIADRDRAAAKRFVVDGGGGDAGAHGEGAMALISKLKNANLHESPSKTVTEGGVSPPKDAKRVAFGKPHAASGRVGAGRGDGEGPGAEIPVGTFVPARKSFQGLRMGSATHAANIFSETYASPPRQSPKQSPKAPVDFSCASNSVVGGEVATGAVPAKVFPKVVIGKGVTLGAPASETLSPRRLATFVPPPDPARLRSGTNSQQCPIECLLNFVGMY